MPVRKSDPPMALQYPMVLEWLSDGPRMVPNGPSRPQSTSMLPLPKKIPGPEVSKGTNHDRQRDDHRY